MKTNPFPQPPSIAFPDSFVVLQPHDDTEEGEDLPNPNPNDPPPAPPPPKLGERMLEARLKNVEEGFTHFLERHCLCLIVVMMIIMNVVGVYRPKRSIPPPPSQLNDTIAPGAGGGGCVVLLQL